MPASPTQRPKGYAPWNPHPGTLRVLQDVRSVLEEYRAHLPLTVRQIFYRLVGQYGYEKTEKAYNRLAEYLVRARRAQLIPFSSIRDDGTIRYGGGGYESEEEWWASVRSEAESLTFDRLIEQPVKIELWCEAAGMVPQLSSAVGEYSVPVYSTGGFSSVTVTHQIAQRALSHTIPTIFLHVGDYDPSGQSIFEAMTEDAKSFLRSGAYRIALQDDVLTEREKDDILYLGRPVPIEYPDLIPVRVALTADQVEEYDLPTAPPKPTDSRSARWAGETCQLEAMPPDQLAELVRGAVEGFMDMDIYNSVLEREIEARGSAIKKLDSLE